MKISVDNVVNKRRTILVRTALFFLVCITAMQAQRSQPQATPVATVPRLVRVSNTFRPANGLPAAPVESVTFSIYREESGGAPLWQETQNVDVDAEGHYTALMGSTLNEGVSVELFSSAEPRWLGVRFNRPGEAEQPRVQLASVPYALKASDAETLGGRPASAYLLDPNAASVSAATATAESSGGAASATTAPGKLKPRTAAGSTNCIAVFTDATDLGCSPMWQSGSNIGIGTHSPAAPLHVVGSANPSVLIDIYGNSSNLRQRRADGTSASPTGVKTGEVIGNTGFGGYGTTGFLATASAAIKGIAAENFSDSTGGGILTFSTMTGGTTNLTERMRLDQNGNVGIGTTTPGFRLDVEGGTINGNNPAASGFAPGVAGTSASANSAGLSGFNSYTAGATGSFPTGVAGNINGPTGAGVAGGAQMAGTAGVNGNNSATAGFAPGVTGTSASANSPGVSGFNNYTAGAAGSFPIGVGGSVNGPTGTGVAGNAQMAGASGVSGFNSATTGNAPGVVGGTASNSGAGVEGNASQAGAFGVGGFNSATSGFALGVHGGTASNNGAGVGGSASQAGAAGVNGNNSATTGFAPGVTGTSASANSPGVSGFNNYTAGATGSFPTGVSGSVNGPTGAGVSGNAQMAGAAGVNGYNNATTGYAVGVQGGTASNNGAGVQGNANNAGADGVQGTNTATSGFAAGVEGDTSSNNGGGVIGIANQSNTPDTPLAGVIGVNSVGSGFAVGVLGATGSPLVSGVGGIGVMGFSGSCSNGDNCTIGAGIGGEFLTATTGILLQGLSGASGAAAHTATPVFTVDGQGNLTIAGTLTASVKNFKIDDPLDPEHKSLYHASIESSEMVNIYSGNVILDRKGEAVVTMPEWFEALNGDFRYQLTTIGRSAPVYIAQEIQNRQFKIAGGRTGMKVSWQVTGVRHDAWAQAHPLQVEGDKEH
jgi:trimeric autotransporter adhesin